MMTLPTMDCYSPTPNLTHTYNPPLSLGQRISTLASGGVDERPQDATVPAAVLVQGWAKKWAPGCENVSGKLGQMWHKQQQEQN